MKTVTAKKRFMRNARTVDFSHVSRGGRSNADQACKLDEEGRLVVSLYSDFFSSLTDNVMCTNAMFENLKKEIEGSVALYAAKSRIALTVYESSKTADDDVREIVMAGFKKYIAQYKARAYSTLKWNTLTFLAIAVIGILLEYFLYQLFPDVFPVWISNLLDIAATVMIWEFVAFIAFEFSREVAGIRRLNQILDVKYTFRHWE